MSDEPTPQSAPPPVPVPDSAEAEERPAQGEREDVSATAALLAGIRAEVGKVFLGQEAVLDQVLAALISGGHVLLEGKPGLGKTHLVLSIAETFGGEFRRIQFTPDLMPSDVTGHTLFDMSSQEFRVRKGPVFCNLLLADEINRAPAKTQASLLEVMQESCVTIDGDTLQLEPPFLVLATQNPIEQEGTYPLPEAQLDRFLFKIVIDYPEAEIEKSIVSRVAGETLGMDVVAQVATKDEINEARKACARVDAVPEVVAYAVNLCRATRESGGVQLGAGTRGAIGLVKAAKAFALIQGRSFTIPDDIKQAALPVLRHRVSLAPELAIAGQTVDQHLLELVEGVEAPRT